jgi:CubicO group peptidase (beta-lactamase class C family)
MRVDGLPGFLDDQGFNGVVVARRDGVTLFEAAHGLASPRWGVPNRLETRFDTASVSKLFTAVAVLQLVGRGALELDAPIHGYADLDGTSIPQEVTLRQLLLHTSGIGDVAEEDDGEQYAEVFRAHPCHMFTSTRDFLPLFVDKPPHFAPGSSRRYCNGGYILAGLAVEHASGVGYREYVEAEVFAPAGMTSSAFFDKRYAHPDLAEGFDPDEAGRLEQNIYAYPPVGAPDGGAFCTAGDLLAFLDAVRRGALLPPDLTEAFFTPQVRIDDELEQGFGLEFNAGGWWKEGCSEGASAIAQHHSGPGVDSVILSNSMEGAWPVVEELDRLATAATVDAGGSA